MTRFIATVEFQDGEYWISFPGIEKTYRLAKQPEDIVLQARAFLDQQAKPVSVAGTMIDADLPPSLDDALTPGTPIEPFEGVRLVIFEWDPPS